MRPTAANAPQLRAVLEARARHPPSVPPPLAEALARFAELPTTGEPPPRSRPALARLPYPPNPNFTGRGDDLRKIAAHLRREPGGTLAVAISGMGGLGKTQLAICPPPAPIWSGRCGLPSGCMGRNTRQQSSTSVIWLA